MSAFVEDMLQRETKMSVTAAGWVSVKFPQSSSAQNCNRKFGIQKENDRCWKHGPHTVELNMKVGSLEAVEEVVLVCRNRNIYFLTCRMIGKEVNSIHLKKNICFGCSLFFLSRELCNFEFCFVFALFVHVTFIFCKLKDCWL